MKEAVNISSRPAESPASGFDLGDVYYIFFRHKWKILLIFLLGLAGAFGVFRMKPPIYESEARVFVKYILEAPAVAPEPGGGTDSRVISADPRGEGIINSQIEILTSFDLAVTVATELARTPGLVEKLTGGGSNVTSAAGVIRGGLLVDVPRRGSVLRVAFNHKNPEVVQPVLRQLIELYKQKQAEIYEGSGYRDEILARQADQFRLKVSETESKLKELKARGQILSLEDDKRAYLAQKDRVEQQVFAAEAELLEQRATLAAWEKLRPGPSAVESADAPVPSEVAERYELLVAELDFLQKQRVGLQFNFTDEHPRLKRLADEIARAESQKRELEQQYTNLLTVVPATAQLAAKGEVDLTTQFLRVSALESKIRFLTNYLARVSAEADRVFELAPDITKLERQLESDRTSLEFYESGLAKARMQDLLADGKVTNISVVQAPTPPARDISGLQKPLAAVLAFGLFGGFALAFLIEKFLDRSLKRMVDLEKLLGVPVFVSVPDLGWRGNRTSRQLTNGEPVNETGALDAKEPVNGNGREIQSVAQLDDKSGGVAPWDSRHLLRSYYEGLRDRLITYFEVRNLTHKPKLVAVTSCRHGAGVTTMAAGLAATLSETGDGNVLLVDMNLERGAAHQFYQGKPGCALSDALDNSTRDTAQVQENFYLVSAHETKNEKLPRALPKRFAHLIPRMKASDYDYIIFDMPPVSQTSVTPRLAGLMDMVLMVVESESTNQDTVKRAHGLLKESRATVATVLNKHRAYVPAQLSQEI